jgi:hypothetical protein
MGSQERDWIGTKLSLRRVDRVDGYQFTHSPVLCSMLRLDSGKIMIMIMIMTITATDNQEMRLILDIEIG